MTPEQLEKINFKTNSIDSYQNASKDEARQFVCGCTKRYGSYAALYTHIKNKHNGEVKNNFIRRLQVKSKDRDQTQEGVDH